MARLLPGLPKTPGSPAGVSQVASPVSPAVGILATQRQEPDLILEDVDSHWEDAQKDCSSSPQEMEGLPAHGKENKAVVEMPRWEPEKSPERASVGMRAESPGPRGHRAQPSPARPAPHRSHPVSAKGLSPSKRLRMGLRKELWEGRGSTAVGTDRGATAGGVDTGAGEERKSVMEEMPRE
ncbi:Hypothetical predicted protein [Marmota monax]|uniref:Uncharacterized protein n=1 Tax=Marmota monax TaxID=9995 RepID=A0A5E4A4L6_MARMO|nr:hypothetical protein GHT09_003160 [Marmota monax]VTJ52177.1 Hypothetical predicted protein [Marmota monax]